MDHVAIDLGGRKSQLCHRDATGQIVEERAVPTRQLDKLLGKLPPCRVIVETSAEAFQVADWALGHGHEVRVVPATLVRSLGVGRRGIKTDVQDARVLSEVSCRIDLPSVHVPSELSRELKSVCTARENLVGCRTRLVNGIRSWLRTQVRSVRATPATLARRVRELMQAEERVLPAYIGSILTTVETINIEIHTLDKCLSKLAQELLPCRRMMSIPGVGPVTAVRFYAALDETGRFPSAAQVQSYLGLTPGENSSGQRQRRTGITKAGPAPVRRALVQAAWSHWIRQPESTLSQWTTTIALKRNKQVAVVALARKLAGIMYALWRDAVNYNPAHQRDELVSAA